MSMGQQISTPLIVILIALLILASFQLREHNAPVAKPSVPEATALAPDLLSQAQLPQFSLPPIEEFSETLARPLFYEARQPPDPSAMNGNDPQAKSESISSEDLILSAIVLSNEEQFVLVQNPGKQSLRRVEKGEEVAGGWSLDEIRDESVLLRRRNRTKVIPLWRFQPPPKRATPRRTRRASKQASQQHRQQPSQVQRRVTRANAND